MCKKLNKYIGICGQGPSDHPDLAKWLMEEGIENLSLTPDSIVKTWLMLGDNIGEKKQATNDMHRNYDAGEMLPGSA